MPATVMDEDWGVLASLLPDGWRELAKDTRAMQRARGAITSPEVLLQVLLLHVGTGLSLKQAVARAHVQSLASITAVALLKRLRASEGWLREMARRLFAADRGAASALPALAGRRLRAVDATTVEEPGATGTDWRVHYCLRADFGDVDHPVRAKPITWFGRCRSSGSVDGDHALRMMPIMTSVRRYGIS